MASLLQRVMGQLVRGGGIRNGINVFSLTHELEKVARSYHVVVPPYFTLVLRAFSTIEGIALKVRRGPEGAAGQGRAPHSAAHGSFLPAGPPLPPSPSGLRARRCRCRRTTASCPSACPTSPVACCRTATRA